MIKLKYNIKEQFGRNRGRISSYHRQGGKKKLFRVIDFWRYLVDVEGKVLTIEKDSYRSGVLGLVYYLNGLISYILLSSDLKVGSSIINIRSKKEIKIMPGLSCLLGSVPVGTKIFNLELIPGEGSKIGRSAGVFMVLVKKYDRFGVVRLASGEFRLFSLDCFCSIGRVGNVMHHRSKIGSAGQSRLNGRRPIVRGRAMNPVDHPHGGRTNGGITPKTPWGLIAKGQKTRKKAVGSRILKLRKK